METLLATPRTSTHHSHQLSQPTAKPLPPITQYIIEYLLGTKQFTKTSLARELQVSLVTINRWATGTIKRPTHKTFSHLLTLYCAMRAYNLFEETSEEAATPVAA